MEATSQNSQGPSLVNGTNDREAHPKRWYVAQVQVKCERKIASRLEALGYETFVATQEEIHQWSDRKKKIERVLIPMVIFVKAPEADSRKIEYLSYVYSLMRAPGSNKPAIVPDYQIEQFKFMLSHRGNEQVTIEPVDIHKGDKVRVTRGGLAGLTGNILHEPTGKSKIVITIEHLSCACIEINTNDIEIINQ